MSLGSGVELDGAARRPARLPRLRRMFASPAAVAATVGLLGLVVVAALAPVLAPYGPNDIDLTSIYEGPSADHWFGTDDVGRDQLSRIVFGARVSLVAAAQAVGIAVLIGLPLGLMAGYVRGWLDTVLSWLNDAFMSVPALILAIAVIAALGPGLSNAMVAVGLVMSPWFFRVTRAATLDVRGETYIEAAVAIGCSHRQVLLRHVLPNIMSPLLVQVSFSLGMAVVIEASLSFLGLGLRPPAASWGGMLLAASRRMDIGHLIYAPGLALVFTVAVFTVIGDAWRDALGVNRGVADG